MTLEPPKVLPEGEVKGAGREHEIVVRGVVLRDDLWPLRHTVVTVLGTQGEPVDWSRADNEGSYSVVLPGPGRYVVVSAAEGWAPRSEILEFTAAAAELVTVLDRHGQWVQSRQVPVIAAQSNRVDIDLDAAGSAGRQVVRYQRSRASEPASSSSPWVSFSRWR